MIGFHVYRQQGKFVSCVLVLITALHFVIYVPIRASRSKVSHSAFGWPQVEKTGGVKIRPYLAFSGICLYIYSVKVSVSSQIVLRRISL
jgi:hypothetical protein